MISVAAFVLLVLPSAQDEEIRRLIHQLSAETIPEREEAELRLIDVGFPARRALQEAAQGKAAELRFRARSILGEIELDQGFPHQT